MSWITKRVARLVHKAIGSNRLIPDGEKVVVGVSGGVDSLCLLHLLVSLNRTGRRNWNLRAILCIWKKLTTVAPSAGGAGLNGLARFVEFCNSPHGRPTVIRPLVHRVASHLTLPVFLENASLMEMPPALPAAIVVAFIDDERLQDNVTNDLATKYYPVFARAINGNTFARFDQRPGLLTAILAEAQARGLDEDTLTLLDELLSLPDLRPVEDFIELAIGGLSGLGREDWTKQLATNGSLLRLALRLRERNVEVGLDVSFQDSLLQLMKEIRLGRRSFPLHTPGASGLDSLLSPKQQTVFWDSMLAGLLESSVFEQPFERLIDGMGTDMIRALPVEEHGNDVFLRLLRGSVSRRNVKELTWARDLLRARPELLNGRSVQTATLFDFRARVAGLASDKTIKDDVRQIAIEIVSLMNETGILASP